MTKKIVDKSEEAYNGKYINFRSRLHQLVPGVDRKSCEGCALYDIPNCPDSITKLCRQGFILKKVKIYLSKHHQYEFVSSYLYDQPLSNYQPNQ